MARKQDKVPDPTTALSMLGRRIWRELFDSYRPELHYMRGPGPKWREKHGVAAPAGVPDATPVHV